MRHNKRFRQLNDLSPKRDIGYIQGKAKKGCAKDLVEAKKLQGLLRDYTYHLIGLGNTFREIARSYGVFHGSNWRTYLGTTNKDIKALMDQLNSMDPYDTDSILKIERALEALAETFIRGEK